MFERRHDAALENAARIFDACPDPEAVYLVARNIAVFGDLRALAELGRALDGGFVIYRVLLRNDPWLDPLRSTREFQDLVERSRETYRESLKVYLDTGGERLLGSVPSPEELEQRIGADDLHRTL